jgi:hypothetical protein
MFSNHDIFGIAECWAGLEVYEINGFICFSKGRTKVAKFGRNPGGLVVYIREGIIKRFTEITTNMKEVLWVCVIKKRNSKVEICIGFVCNAPQSSRWYNPNFTRELEEDMKELSDRFLNAEFVIVGDMNSRVGIMQINLPHTLDCFDEIDKYNDSQFGKRISKDFSCNTEERR